MKWNSERPGIRRAPRAASCLLAVLAAAVATPAEAQDFCTLLKQAIRTAPQSFSSLRGRFDPQPSSKYARYWTPRIQFAGARYCYIQQHTAGFAMYSCHMSSPRAPAARKNADFQRDVGRVTACLRGIAGPSRFRATEFRWAIGSEAMVKVRRDHGSDDDEVFGGAGLGSVITIEKIVRR